MFRITDGTSNNARTERGQATVLLTGVIALTCLLGLGITLVAQAMVHRGRARNAADAVALATVIDDTAAAELRDWYDRRHIEISVGAGYARANSGPSQAAAWAGLGEASGVGAAAGRPAPVLVAIIARAEQLVGSTFTQVKMHDIRVDLGGDDGVRMQIVAAELGLCSVVDPALAPEWQACELC